VSLPHRRAGYVVVALVVLGLYADQIPATFGLIFHHAFNPTAATGGFVGAGVMTLWLPAALAVAATHVGGRVLAVQRRFFGDQARETYGSKGSRAACQHQHFEALNPSSV
jgi:Na+/alanine symporter